MKDWYNIRLLHHDQFIYYSQGMLFEKNFDVPSLKKRTKKKYSQNIWRFSYTISNKRNNNYFRTLWKIDTTFVYYITISSY